MHYSQQSFLPVPYCSEFSWPNRYSFNLGALFTLTSYSLTGLKRAYVLDTNILLKFCPPVREYRSRERTRQSILFSSDSHEIVNIYLCAGAGLVVGTVCLRVWENYRWVSRDLRNCGRSA